MTQEEGYRNLEFEEHDQIFIPFHECRRYINIAQLAKSRVCGQAVSFQILTPPITVWPWAINFPQFPHLCN